MEKIIITALDEENGIGLNGELPWHYPEDLRQFKEKTMNHPVLMGRTTYQSLPENFRPLPGRTNIVLTRSDPKLDESVEIANSLDEAWRIASKNGEKVFIAGGSSVYQQCMDIADKMFITRIPGTHSCDTFFPEWTERNWELVKTDENGELVFEEYIRKT